MDAFKAELLKGLATIVIAGVNLAIGYVFMKYLAKATERAKAETANIKDEGQRRLANDAIDRIDKIVRDNVIRLNETLVVGVKAAIADGKADKSDLANIANLCKDDVLSQLTTDVIDTAKTQVTDVQTYILTRIENELAGIKGRL